MFLSNWGLTLNLEIQYPAVDLICVSVFIDCVCRVFFGGPLSLADFIDYGYMCRKWPELHSHVLSSYKQFFMVFCRACWASQVVLVVKNLPVNAEDARDVGSIPGLGIPFREGHGNPLQYSCLENPMDGGAWKTTVHGVAKSWICMDKWFSTHAHRAC